MLQIREQTAKPTTTSTTIATTTPRVLWSSCHLAIPHTRKHARGRRMEERLNSQCHLRLWSLVVPVLTTIKIRSLWYLFLLRDFPFANRYMEQCAPRVLLANLVHVDHCRNEFSPYRSAPGLHEGLSSQRMQKTNGIVWTVWFGKKQGKECQKKRRIDHLRTGQNLVSGNLVNFAQNPIFWVQTTMNHEVNRFPLPCNVGVTESESKWLLVLEV